MIDKFNTLTIRKRDESKSYFGQNIVVEIDGVEVKCWSRLLFVVKQDTFPKMRIDFHTGLVARDNGLDINLAVLGEEKIT